MSVLHERAEALEKIGAGALADQALLKLIRLHLQKYEKHLTEVRKELEPFEQQYGISSEESATDVSWRAKWGTLPILWSGWGCMTMCSSTENALQRSAPRLRHHNACLRSPSAKSR